MPGVIAPVTEPLSRMLDDAARRFPDRVAIDFLGASTTYARLSQQVARAAETLRRLGVGRGDVVGVILPNCPQHVVIAYAAWRIGAIVAEHNPLAPAAQIREQIEIHGGRVMIAWEKSLDRLTRATGSLAAAGQGEWGGLSPFGREVVVEMNRIGMMIDVSHAADATFDDVVRLSRRPIIASHSSCRALCNHRRNLDDDRIRALAATGGVMQICLYGGFINHDHPDSATLSDAVRHIMHVVQLVGPNHVGIGSDFDGGGGLIGCQSAGEMIQITLRLLAEGLSDADIAKIWGGNFMRVMDAQRETLA